MNFLDADGVIWSDTEVDPLEVASRGMVRYIRTLDELAELPEFTVIHWENSKTLTSGVLEYFDRSWWEPGNHVRIDPAMVPLPAVVIWDGGQR